MEVSEQTLIEYPSGVPSSTTVPVSCEQPPVDLSKEVAAIRGAMQLIHQSLSLLNDLIIMLSFKGYTPRSKTAALADSEKPAPETPLASEMMKFRSLVRRSRTHGNPSVKIGDTVDVSTTAE